MALRRILRRRKVLGRFRAQATGAGGCIGPEDIKIIKEDYEVDEIEDIFDEMEYPTEDYLGGWVPYWDPAWLDMPYGILQRNLEKHTKCELLTKLLEQFQ